MVTTLQHKMNPFSKAYTPQLETADLAKTAHQRVVQKAKRKERMQSTDPLAKAQATGSIMGIKPKETP